MAQKNIKVDFPIPVSEKGRIKANDAKKLLKYLAAEHLLKVGMDYFVTDSTGHEEMWTFQKSMDWEHDYEFSCEVFDDDRDFYNCLYFNKKSGKIDYKSCEFEAHLVECTKKEGKMNEYTELANRFADWYEAQINANEDGLSNEGCEAERIIRKYLGKSMDQMGVDECIDALPAEGKIEIYDFLNNEKMNEFVDAYGDEYTADDVFNFLNEDYDVPPEWRIEGLMHEFGMTRDEAMKWLAEWDKEINKPEEKMNESVAAEYKSWLAAFAPNYDVSNEDAFEAGVKAGGKDYNPEDYNDWIKDYAPDYDVSNYDAFEAGYNFEDNRFVFDTLKNDLEMLGFHLENQGTTVAYPEYFGEGRDGYMFAEEDCNPSLWAVVDVSRRPKFCVDIMETDNDLQQTEDIDNRCDLSYEEMLDYIKSWQDKKWENFDADTYEKYLRLCQHEEVDPYSEEDWRRLTGITKEMEESVEKMTESFNGAKFEKHIPQNMRYKFYQVVDGDLYWVTQEPFDEMDEMDFAKALGLYTPYKYAYVICRDASRGYERDMNSPYIHEIVADDGDLDDLKEAEEESEDIEGPVNYSVFDFSSLEEYRDFENFCGFNDYNTSDHAVDQFEAETIEEALSYAQSSAGICILCIEHRYNNHEPIKYQINGGEWKDWCEDCSDDFPSEYDDDEEDEEEFEESVTLEVYDAEGHMIDRQPGFKDSNEARSFVDYNEDQYPADYKVVIKYNESAEEDEFEKYYHPTAYDDPEDFDWRGDDIKAPEYALNDDWFEEAPELEYEPVEEDLTDLYARNELAEELADEEFEESQKLHDAIKLKESSKKYFEKLGVRK